MWRLSSLACTAVAVVRAVVSPLTGGKFDCNGVGTAAIEGCTQDFPATRSRASGTKAQETTTTTASVGRQLEKTTAPLSSASTKGLETRSHTRRDSSSSNEPPTARAATEQGGVTESFADPPDLDPMKCLPARLIYGFEKPLKTFERVKYEYIACAVCNVPEAIWGLLLDNDDEGEQLREMFTKIYAAARRWQLCCEGIADVPFYRCGFRMYKAAEVPCDCKRKPFFMEGDVDQRFPLNFNAVKDELRWRRTDLFDVREKLRNPGLSDAEIVKFLSLAAVGALNFWQTEQVGKA